MQISRLDPADVDGVWPLLREKILKFLETPAGQRMTEAYYYSGATSGDLVTWIGHEGHEVVAAGFLSVTQYPNQKILFIALIVGDRLDEWLCLAEPLLHEFKQLVGASTIEALCRPGLVKKLKNWRKTAVLMEL